MELSVFDLAMMRWLSASFVACLLTEMVRCPTSRFSHRGAKGVDAPHREAAEPRLLY